MPNGRRAARSGRRGPGRGSFRPRGPPFDHREIAWRLPQDRSIVVPSTSHPGRRQATRSSLAVRSRGFADRVPADASDRHEAAQMTSRKLPGQGVERAASRARLRLSRRQRGVARHSMADASTTSPSPASAAAVSSRPLSRSGSLIATRTSCRSVEHERDHAFQPGRETTHRAHPRAKPGPGCPSVRSIASG